MSILDATDREVVVIDVERGTSASAHGIGDRPTCLAGTRWFAGVRGAAPTRAACSGAMTAEGPGIRLASQAA